ncbi:23S rRNA (adenine(1618)-N(6))-methyltransferase RlmF [Pedobacter steynii]|uniref:Ribosomal RNA large subunit methyltransferase F n=1 Tax=Pedobacter steynii TaxID=430522 RepID=A0A1D7QGQ6_9SPHI|nr:23S rRNA (adenine(1618)-N(6))-methyltransferase RlmF [Pedobacter steynii]AOM77841.1 23S rRNA (adenine(1618)-N(6))-methyltransferase [Pedobacter steynii]
MSIEKQVLHPRNKHRSRYNFPELIKSIPELRPFVAVNAYGDESIDFSDPVAVKLLNRALLKHFYQIDYWDIPEGYLCPPIPGRADYIHYLADLLASVNGGVIPTGKNIKGLDIGLGANCIYPIIGHQEYGWTFAGSDVDTYAIKSAKNIASINPSLAAAVFPRLQSHKNHIFKGVIKPGETFDFTLCNPPFHASAEEAQAGSQRKLRNLGKQKGKGTVLNFGGQQAELWCEGGEVGFIRKMIEESATLGKQCFWFTTLVSKSMNVPFIYGSLERQRPIEIRTIEMAQGQKISRFVAWTFLTPEEQNNWRKNRW